MQYPVLHKSKEGGRGLPMVYYVPHCNLQPRPTSSHLIPPRCSHTPTHLSSPTMEHHITKTPLTPSSHPSSKDPADVDAHAATLFKSSGSTRVSTYRVTHVVCCMLYVPRTDRVPAAVARRQRHGQASWVLVCGQTLVDRHVSQRVERRKLHWIYDPRCVHRIAYLQLGL